MDIEGQLHDNTTGIDIMVEEEGGDASLCLAVDDRPVDRSRPTILWEQGGMDIKSAVFRHGPHHFGQHTEGHHHLKVGVKGFELTDKRLILHLLRLKDGQAVSYGILFYCRWLQHAAMPSDGFIGLCHHGHYIIVVTYESVESLNGKLRCSHEHDT